MKCLPCVSMLLAMQLLTVWSTATEPEKDVPWRAQAEIARRGAMVERVDGVQDAGDSASAIAVAMQPPADDSHKWVFTLVTSKSCQWCEQLRRDFESDPKLKAWVSTKDHARSWAHWQVVQIEDQSQAWRWKDFKPTVFPTLIVQPPINGSWGDPHTIVFARQGYLKPGELDAAIRKAIQLYAAKTFPQRLAWETKSKGGPTGAIVGDADQARFAGQPGGWNPPVPPPAPLPAPGYPSVPPEFPQKQPDVGSLLGQLLSSLLGGPALANILLLAILAWQIYRGIAKSEGIPLLIDDATAAQLVQLLKSLGRPTPRQPEPPMHQGHGPVSNS